MLTPVYRTAAFLCRLVSALPIGTNLGVVHLLWTVLSGQLLQSRGALFPALSGAGLSEKEVRQAEAALREGKWCIDHLLARFGRLVRRERFAAPGQIGPWRPLLIDWVGFFRPQLRDCTSKHFASQAGKALPAIELGMVASVQQVEGRRIPGLRALNRSGDTTELLRLAKEGQGKQEALIADRQVKMSHIEETGVRQFVIRGQQNLSARRSQPPTIDPSAPKPGPRPRRGALVRPTPRTYNQKRLPATEPDRQESFTYQKRTIHARWFDRVVVSGATRPVHCLVLEDPRYKTWFLSPTLGRSPPRRCTFCTGRAGASNIFPRPVSSCSVVTAPLFMGRRAATACRRYVCSALPWACTCQPPRRPCRPASGIASRGALPGGSDGGLRRPNCPDFVNYRRQPAEFARKGRLTSTCRRELRRTEGSQTGKVPTHLPESKVYK